jgi:SAM-dependent methyltransferase
MSFLRNESILDVGCGTGIYLKEIEDEVGISVGLDNSEKMIKQAKRICHKSSFIIDDAEKFDLNMKFDKVLCLGVLEFCKNPKKVWKNCLKHLKKKGRFVVLYPKANFFGYFYKLYHFITSRERIHLFRQKEINFFEKHFNLIKTKQVEFFFSVIVFYDKV